MENVVLIIHLLLALSLIGIVLLQRSEGGGLGLGGGGGGGAAKTGRSAGTAMGKLTWILAAAFIVTSISLTVIAAQKAANESVISGAPASAEGSVPAGSDLLPTLETAPADAAEEEAPRAD
ncbi:preprotein translocase, SecG subunit [Rhodobacterales bacterium HTCC2150]|nr:preprotein translocase, SecG subunit [Rhodobacterales bacterium HTCC2150] [Rhodobacteraceae bacterium HTCC2150]